ncbi:MAG: peptidylprolyl isomerase [Oscillospiraceae bacterium]
MSASNDKKNQDSGFAGYTNPKAAREEAARKKEKRTNIMYATIGIVFVLVAIIVVVWNSGILEKTATAATINGEKYSAAEVSYYYANTYNSFMNQNGSYASMLGLDPQKPLKSQPCSFAEGKTWYDYFLEQATSQMSAVIAMSDKATESGMTWDDSLQAKLDESLAALSEGVKNYNAQSGGTMTDEQYLQAMYGTTMTMDTYQAQLKLSLLADAYSTQHQDSLTYTDSDLAAEYKANAKSYDVVAYERVLFDSNVPTTDADGNEVTVTDAQKTEAVAKAKTDADALLAKYQAGTAKLADETVGTYYEAKADTYSDSALMNWLFDAARKPGDAAVVEEEGSGAYVVVFGTRSRNDYNTVNVRHILLSTPASELKEEDEGYAADVAKLKAKVKTDAEALLASWKSGAATQDSFAALAKEKSEDGGSKDNGGLYEGVYKGQMVETFNDWCFDGARKTGDTGVVETDYGAHIMYYVGAGEPYWQVQVRNALKEKDFSAWYAEQTKGYEVTTNKAGIQYVG